MNHVYRIVFNRSLGVMQVASELTSAGGQGGGSPARKARRGAQAALLAALTLSGLPAGAQTATWNATVGEWGTAGNWAPQALPGAASDVVINTSSAAVTQNLAGGVSANSLSVTAGQLAITGGNLTATNGVSITGSGTVRVDAGRTLTASGSSRITVNGANARFDMSGFANNLTLNAGTVNLSTVSGQSDALGGTTILNGGTLNVLGSAGSVVNGLSGASASRIELGGSGYLVMRQNGNYTYAGTVSGNGSVHLAQAVGTTTIFSGDSSAHDGVLTVQEGDIAFDATGRTGVSVIFLGLNTAAGLTTTASGTFTHSGVYLWGDAASAITLGGSETVGAIGAFAGTINLANTHTLTVGSYTSNFAGTLAGAGGLTVANSANLTLAAANTYSGPTRVDGGTLIAAHGSALGSAASGTTVASGATLGLQGGIDTLEPITLNGAGVSGSGALRNVAGENTVRGPVSLGSDARIEAESSTYLLFRGAVALGTNALTLAGAGGAGGIQLYQPISGSGDLVISGADKSAIFSLYGNSNTSHTGDTYVNGGTLVGWGGNALSDTGRLTVNASAFGASVRNSETVGNIAGNGRIFVTGNGSTLTAGDARPSSIFSGEIAQGDAASNFVKQGTGTLILAGQSSYTGTTRVNAGTLALTGNGRLASPDLQVAAGARLEADGGALASAAAISNSGTVALINGGDESIASLNGGGGVELSTDSVLTLNADASAISGVVSGDGGLTVAGTSNTTLSASNTYTGATTVTGGALNLNGGSAIADTGAVVVDAGTLVLNASETVGSLAGTGGTVNLNANTLTTGGNNGSTAYAGSLAGPGGSLVKTGTGTFTLSGGNSYTGATSVSAGTLVAANDNALGSIAGGTTVANGATLGLQGNITTFEALTLSGNGVGDVGALHSMGSNNVWGGINLQGSTRITSDGGNLDLRGSITGAGSDLTVGGTSTAAVYGAIATGGGGLTKDGGATLSLIGTNTYTGATTVNEGALAIFNGSALSDTADLTVRAGALVQVGASETVGNINGDGNITLYFGSTLTAGDATPLSVFSGRILQDGAVGSLVKQGTGTLQLTGSSIYTGSTGV
ncbi:MAG: hypothetical protein EOO29_17760, partial [Comamonadaceae bacterium]